MNASPLDTLEQALSRFVAVLDGESAALAVADTDALARALGDKETLSGEVSAAWTAGMAWLRAQSPGSARQPLEIPAALTPRWQSIVALARRAEALNQSNGQQIEALLERTRGALGVLQAAARPVDLYGADGHLLDASRPGNTIDSV